MPICQMRRRLIGAPDGGGRGPFRYRTHVVAAALRRASYSIMIGDATQSAARSWRDRKSHAKCQSKYGETTSWEDERSLECAPNPLWRTRAPKAKGGTGGTANRCQRDHVVFIQERALRSLADKNSEHRRITCRKMPSLGGEEPEGGRMSDAGCPTEVVVAMAPATCTGPLCQALALYCSDASKATDGRRCSATLGSLSQATTSLKRSGFKDVQSDRAQSTWWREHDC